MAGAGAEAVLDALPYPTLLLTPERRITRANRAGQDLAVRALGRRVTRGEPIDTYLTEAQLAHFRTAFETALGGEPVTLEGPVSTSDGETWFDIRFTPVGEGAPPAGVCVSLFNIDDRRRAHEALAQSERRFRLVLQHAADGVTVIALDGSILYISPAVERIFGYTPEEMTGTDGFSYIHPDDLSIGMALFRDSVAEPEQTHSCTLRMRRKDGSYAHMELVNSTLVDDPAFGGIVVNARDVSERVLLEDRLRLADRMASLGTLSAGIAHEINNPLAYVVGGLELLEQALAAEGASGDATAALRRVEDGVERVRRIVRDLKTFSRGGDPDRPPRVVSLAEVVESALALAQNEIRHRARLVRRFEAAPSVLADETRLAQALLSLLINAAQAIPEGAAQDNEIRVTLRAEDGTAVVSVQDTGRGIPADILPRIFDPFFTTKPVGVGTGLGLSISHGIITDAGGEIRVNGNDDGTTFEVRLPEAEGEAPTEPAGGRPAPSTRRARILIVDDEPLAGQTLRLLLAEYHQVEALDSGREALDRLAKDPSWDVVLCDLMMPDLSGADLHAALAERAPHYLPRMIFVTGGAFTTKARSFVEQVPNQILEKPFTLAEALQAVDRVVSAERS